MIGYAVLFLALAIAAITDIRKRIIPDTVHIALLVSGVILIFGYGQPWVTRISAFFIVGILMLFVGVLDLAGGGDMKIMPCLVFVLGFFPGLCALIVSLYFAAICSLLRKRDVPLAPFLLCGCITVLAVQTCFPFNILI